MKTATSSLWITGLLLAALPAIGWSAGPDFAGTRWQLVAIQSMDDAQGSTKIPDPSQFTLEFGQDGQAAFRLDCNRGTGNYTLNPAADGNSGSISFGPIAATRALCPPPHLDERVARDMAHVRGYLLKEGKLYLSLMADGGIYEWAPLHTAGTAAAAATPVLGQPAAPVAGVVLGKVVQTADAEELRYYALRELTGVYAEQKGIKVSPEEIARYRQHVDAFMKQDAARLGETAAPAAPMTAEEKASRNEIAAAFIRQWKINGALYRQYGGRVIFQQGGPEPLDAYRQFLEQAQKRGEFLIVDRNLETGFWAYFRNDAIHAFMPAKAAASAFRMPPWERPE